MRICCGRPSALTTSQSTTVPWYLALRASSEYSGSGAYSALGALTPPPTRYAPPPYPPPCPGPTPGPVPEPTPPPLPLPMPPPNPVPLEGGPITLDKGSPSAPIVGSLISGGTTTVGVTTSLGFSLRTTIAASTIWSLACLGNAPWGACSLWRSPPPPPPPARVFDTGIGKYGLTSVTNPTTCCLISSWWVTTQCPDQMSRPAAIMCRINE